MKPSKLLSSMDTLSYWAFLITILLLPFFFIPFLPVNIVAIKGAFLTIGLTISALCYVVARFVDGEVSFPKTRINLALILVTLSVLVSALFSPAFYKSMFGLSFEIGTFTSALSMLVIYFLGVRYTANTESRSMVIKGIFISFIASFAIIVHTFFLGSNHVFARIFTGLSNVTLVGSWSEFGIYSACVILLSLCSISLNKNSLLSKIGLGVVIFCGLLVVALINIVILWVLLGAFSLLFFVYIVSASHRPGQIPNVEKQSVTPVVPFLVVVVSILFILGNNLVGNMLAKKFNFTNTYIQPSLVSTLNIYKNESKSSFLRGVVGSGPVRFAQAWTQYKPAKINDGIYWDTSFIAGYGTILTYLVTCGILGLLAWLYFLILYFATGIRVLLLQLKTEFFDSALVTTFFVSAFLWVVNIFLTSSIVVFVLAFVMTTLFVSTLASRRVIEVPTSTYLKDPRNSFFAILFLVVIMIGSIVGLYFSIVKVASLVEFTKGAQSSDFAIAEKHIRNAVTLQNKNDDYYRALSAIYITKLNTVLQEKDNQNLQTSVQQLLSGAQAANAAAISADNTNFINWFSLGQFFELATTLGAQGDPYKNGVDTYAKAIYFAPNNPAVSLAQARLEIANKNISGANKFIDKALELKKDYIAAYQLRAQLIYNDKNYQGAYDQLTTAISYSQSADLYISRGTLLTQMGRLADATSDFRNAFALVQNQTTAYLLASADIRSGNIDEATKLVDALLAASPDNQDFKDLHQKLLNAKNPAPVVTPTTNTKK